MQSENSNLNRPLYAVGVGASAGGLEAISDFLANLPADLDNVSVIIAQHLSPTYKSRLVQLLSRETKLPVAEAADGLKISSGNVYITPPDSEITVADGAIRLAKSKGRSGPKPSIDTFFHSLALEFKNRSIGIILSGTGTDGTQGVKAIRTAGGVTIVQEPQTAKFNGMPTAAIATGCIDLVVSPDIIGEELKELISADEQLPVQLPPSQTPHLQKLFDLIAKKSSTDFSSYKRTTISRRIEKRLGFLKIKDISQYIKYIKKTPKELDLLFASFLIGVTRFFRDPEAFGTMEKYLKKLVIGKKPGDTIRIWCAGCSTGEEAYSIAISLTTMLGSGIHDYNVQIIATDINESAIAVARKGVYPKEALEHVPQTIRDEFFHIKGNELEVIKSVRMMVLFSKHDLVSNPPFLKLDMISCRNLLIYFNAELQKTVIPLFHYSLNSNGYLFLGKSETIGSFADLFIARDAKYKVFQRIHGKDSRTRQLSTRRLEKIQLPGPRPDRNKMSASIADRIKETLFSTFEHPYVVITDRMEVLEIVGEINNYLVLSPGSMDTNIISLANKSLQVQLRSAISRSIKERLIVRIGPKKISNPTGNYYVMMTIKPILHSAESDALYMVIFEQQEIPDLIQRQEPVTDGENSPGIRELEQELFATKEQLQAYIEEMESSNEELQSLNEELQSTNEELQSTNEELETSNEELQSTNEEVQIAYSELNAVNQALEKKDVLLTESEANTKALLNNSLQSFVLIDKAYKIVAFNSVAQRTMSRLFDTDIKPGDSIIDFTFPGHLETFRNDFNQALKGHTVSNETCVKNTSGDKNSWYLYNYTPVVDAKGEIKVVSLGILDISTEKRLGMELMAREQLIRSIFQTVQVGICVTDEHDRFVTVNDTFCVLSGYTSQELIGQPISLFTLLPAFEFDNLNVDPTAPMETYAKRKDGHLIDILTVTSNLTQENVSDLRITTVQDITSRKVAERKFNDQYRELEKANSELDLFVYSASHDLRAPLTSMMGLINIAVQETSEPNQLQYLKMMEKSIHKLDGYIKDIVSYSRNSRLDVEKQKICFGTLIHETIENLKFMGNADRIEYKISIDEEFPYYSDKSRINTVIDNIISNSIKYQRKDIKPFVAISVKTSATNVEIILEDNGEGIAEEHLPKVFDMFFRSSVSNSGSGLGLFIVKETVHKLKGTVDIMSLLNKGTTLVIRIPNHSDE